VKKECPKAGTAPPDVKGPRLFFSGKRWFFKKGVPAKGHGPKTALGVSQGKTTASTRATGILDAGKCRKEA